jgi:cysteine-rich repeat protein
MRRTAAGALTLSLALLLALPARATTITVVNADGAGEGFNDATAVAPVGGNPGTTRGAQRLNAFQFAADIWAGILLSSVEIRINATFDPLPCNNSSAVLGQAGPHASAHDFPGAPLANTWYPIALANALATSDLDPGNDDIDATFNSSIGVSCNNFHWYYGYDANPPSGYTDFIAVVLHELGHGLGFVSLVDDSTGALANGLLDTFSVNLEDHSTGKTWGIMTNTERKNSAIDTGDLHWVGANVVAASGFLTAGRHASGHVQMYAPNPRQPGSSVSHWDTALTPNEVMEPAYTGPQHDPHLAIQLMQDIGWLVAECGNGVIEGAETCDDGDTSDGDGCSHACQVENCFSCTGQPSTCTPLGDGSGCDDGNACTQTDTCTSGVCNGTNPVVCTALDQCHQVGICNTSTGLCSNPTQPDGTGCNDGESCTTGDQCTSGACAGAPTCVDPFLCYKSKVTAKTPKFLPVLGVNFLDAFESITGDAKTVKHLCTPADLNGGSAVDTATHLENYHVVPMKGTPKHVPQNLVMVNAIGTISLTTIKTDLLMVPTAKNPAADPPPPGVNAVDDYKCYTAKVTKSAPKFPKGVTVTLADQFVSPAKSYAVSKPSHLCTPVDIGSPRKHLAIYQVCYKVKPATPTAKQIGLHVNNTFQSPGLLRLDTVKEDVLCVPSVQVP